MNADDIKQAITTNRAVYWKSKAYQVIRDYRGNYLIECQINGNCIGLVWNDNETLNGKEEDFYIE